MDLATAIRPEFPGVISHPDYVYGDAATGTQFHRSVVDAVTDYMTKPGAHLFGEYPGAVNTIETTTRARRDVAALFNCEPSEVTFGPNTTSLMFSLSRSLGNYLKKHPNFPNINVVVTNLDHDANVTPFVKMAEDLSPEIEVRRIDINISDCTLKMEDYDEFVDENTVLVCTGAGANSTGTVNPVKRIIKKVKEITYGKCLTVVDAVHYIPHFCVDVKDFDCDFLACSTFKFFGPHAGLLFMRQPLMEELKPYKLVASRDALADDTSQMSRWETGTLNFEGLAGISAQVHYFASLGERFGGAGKDCSLRKKIELGYEAIGKHEAELTRNFLQGVSGHPNITVYGIKDPESGYQGRRTPTFAVRLKNFENAMDLTSKLGEEKIISQAGHFYAIWCIRRLGLEQKGGVVRIGFVHYNSKDDVIKVVKTLRRLTK